MDIAKNNMSRDDLVQFHKELDKKGYMARSAYLEVMLNGLFEQVIDMDLHQGHYHPIKEVYDNFNDLLEKFEDQIESVKKDKTLFAILPYELYRDSLVHWLVTHKYIHQAIDIPSDGSMEKITWAYLNALFDHRFKDTLSEADFLHAVKGLHGILDKSVQNKYDLESFGKPGVSASIHAPQMVYVEKEKIMYVEKNSMPKESSNSIGESEKSQPSLLQQRRSKIRSVYKSKLTLYDKVEVKDILTMALQLSEKLDIPITDGFDRAEEILSLLQPKTRSKSKSCSRSRGCEQPQNQPAYNIHTHWHQADDPQKITDLAMTIKALLDAKPKPPVNKKHLPAAAKFSNSQLSSSSSKQDRVTWAPTPQIARIDKILELEYLSSSLESQITKDQERLKNKSRPPPSDDSLVPYEEAFMAEPFEQ
ncbi:hypothetical protein AX15_005485 [Amanita polypyramis BW_CC]|nr:hypothetical protein AX15_005485 [Amanita polypyramis BW_CC]